MKRIYPDFYPDFHCLAGNCPDTCCKDWEVVVDAASMELYKTLTGELGKRLKDAFVRREGETCFRLGPDGRCVLLTKDGMCPLQAQLGERGLCHICASHPRFIEEYGAVQELTLSISCPEAARLLLEHPEPIRFITEETDEPVTTPNTLSPGLYFAVHAVREAALRLAQDRSRPIRDRLSLTLLLAVRAQRLLDQRRYEAVHTLTARFATRGVQERQLLRLRRLRRRSADFFPLWMLLRNMEHLTQEFPSLLDACAHAPRPEEAFFTHYAAQLENLMVYFLFRYPLKAAVDGALLEKMGACVFHVLAISRLFAAQEEKTPQRLRELCTLYSKEVEHSEENRALLCRAIRRGALRVKTLCAIM